MLASRTRMSRRAWLPVLLLAAACLSGCGTAGYYAQAVHGHLQIMQAARPLQDWLDDPATAPELAERLRLAQQVRDHASSVLALPDNRSYRRYAELKRSHAVWNVVAAPPDSLVLERWCFPVAGCVGYRGYFDEARARQLAGRLQDRGLEVMVYGVPAYSTLGRLNWAGGDPLLSTFALGLEADMVRLVFHELAHQRLYVRGDTRFNESYATAVERLGLQQWLEAPERAAAARAYVAVQQRRQAFRGLLRDTHQRLQALYARKPELAADALLHQKNDIVAGFRQAYERLRAPWLAAGLDVSALDRWVQQANNASFALHAAYDGDVPAFEALFASVRGDWPEFHRQAQLLSRLPASERRLRLQELAGPAAEQGEGRP